MLNAMHKPWYPERSSELFGQVDTGDMLSMYKKDAHGWFIQLLLVVHLSIWRASQRHSTRITVKYIQAPCMYCTVNQSSIQAMQQTWISRRRDLTERKHLFPMNDLEWLSWTEVTWFYCHYLCRTIGWLFYGRELVTWVYVNSISLF